MSTHRARCARREGSPHRPSSSCTTATTGVQGSGWGVLGYQPLSRRLIIEQVHDHHGNDGAGTTPLLVFDAWEHAYSLQFRNIRPDYVTQWWDLVDRNDVAERCAAAVGVGTVPSVG